METQFGALTVEVRDRVATVTIDAPPANLVGGPFIMGLLGLLPALDAAHAADEVRVVVFRSADPDFFLMHGDVESILGAGVKPYEPATAPNIAAVTFQRLSSAPYVSIGAIDGAARGGGAEFLTALDLRVGTPRTVLGQPEVPMGILPGAGGTSRLPRLLGRSRALEIILTARDVDAEEAVRIGWLDAVVPGDQLEHHVAALAARIAASPPASVAQVKRVVDVSLSPIDLALVAETDAYAQLTATGQHIEPMQRFLAAGGQTRAGEAGRAGAIEPLFDAMVRGAGDVA